MNVISRKRRMNVLSWAKFVGPIFIIYTLFFAVPLFQGIFYSFTNWGGIESNVEVIGIKNYVDIFTNDSNFWESIGRTLLFTVWNILLTNVIGMLFALALSTRFKFNRMIRTAIFLPNMISMVIVGFIWLFMYTKLAPIAYDSLGIEILGRSFLSSEYVIGSIVVVSLWHGIGYIMTIYIGALSGVDANIVEAARIDGANENQVFWKVKIPSIMPILGVGIFINISGSLKIFDIVMSMTAGGPGRSSEVVMLNIYREAFVNNNMGYGAAKATILSLIIIVVALLQFKFTSESEA